MALLKKPSTRFYTDFLSTKTQLSLNTQFQRPLPTRELYLPDHLILFYFLHITIPPGTPMLFT